MSYKIYLSSFILITYLLVIFYISSISWVLESILLIIIYLLFFYFLHFIWKKIRKKEIMSTNEYIKYFLYRVSIFLVFITVFFWWLSYLSNEIYPAKMPEYTISNWEKEVKFQAMSHIATNNFYNNVAKNIEEYKKNWWVYFYEWVKAWSEENLEKFNNAIWVEFDSELYKNFSKLYWVSFQDNNLFLGLINELDFNIDLSIDEIINIYEEKIKSSEKENINEVPAIDANKIINETLASLNEKQLKILVYINQAILNFIISSDKTKDFLSNNFSNEKLFEVILDERNKILKNAIIDSEYNKIYITYWLLHFKWVFELLQEQDPKWKIISVKNLFPVK